MAEKKEKAPKPEKSKAEKPRRLTKVKPDGNKAADEMLEFWKRTGQRPVDETKGQRPEGFGKNAGGGESPYAKADKKNRKPAPKKTNPNRPPMGQNAGDGTSPFPDKPKTAPAPEEGGRKTPTVGERPKAQEAPKASSNKLHGILDDFYKKHGDDALRQVVQEAVRLGGPNIMKGVLATTGFGAALMGAMEFLAGNPAGTTPEEENDRIANADPQQFAQNAGEGSDYVPPSPLSIPEPQGTTLGDIPPDFAPVPMSMTSPSQNTRAAPMGEPPAPWRDQGQEQMMSMMQSGITPPRPPGALEGNRGLPPQKPMPPQGMPQGSPGNAPGGPPGQPQGQMPQQGGPVGNVQTKGGNYPVYQQGSAPAKDFKSAFRQAREAWAQGAGPDVFDWQGRKYTVYLAGEKPNA